jgi:DNA-binding IclR family transcriptional regulator
LQKLEEARKRGYVVSIQERYLYTIGVAAPVLVDQTVVGSLAIIGPAERIRAFGLERTGKVVPEIAEKFSSELSYDSGKNRIVGSAIAGRRGAREG